MTPFSEMNALRDRMPNLAHLDGNIIIIIHVKLISKAEFTGKLSTRVVPHVHFFEFYGRTHLKVGTTICTTVQKIFGPPPRGPQRAPEGPKNSLRPLQETNSISSNRLTAKRSLLVYVYIYMYIRL